LASVDAPDHGSRARDELNPSADNMMQRAGGIDAGFTRHGSNVIMTKLMNKALKKDIKILLVVARPVPDPEMFN